MRIRELHASAGQAIYGFCRHNLIDALVDAIPGLCNGLKVMLNITNDQEPNANVADALRFSIAALSHLGKHTELRERMADENNAAHKSTARVVQRNYLWMKKIFKLDMKRVGQLNEDDTKRRILLDQSDAVGEKPETDSKSDYKLKPRLHELGSWTARLMAELTDCIDSQVRSAMVRVSFESFLNSMALCSLQSFEPRDALTPSHVPDQRDAAVAFLGDALRTTSLMLFSVVDPSTGYGHYCHMDDLRPVLQAMRRFPKSSKIALWGCTILKDVSVTHANLVKIGKLGGTEAITLIMMQHLEKSEVQLRGLRALYSLLAEEKASVDLAVSCGLEEHLVNVLKLHRHVPEIRSLASQELKIIDYNYIELLHDNVESITNQLDHVRLELDECSDKAGNFFDQSATPYKKK